MATDVGLYHCEKGKAELYQDENELISCYLKGLSINSEGELWVGGLGGVTVRKGKNKLKALTPGEGIPSVHVNSVDISPDGTMWVGTEVGVAPPPVKGNPVAIGIDIGGTKMAVAVVDSQGRQLARGSLPTEAELGFDRAVDRLGDAIEGLLSQAGGRRSGMGSERRDRRWGGWTAGSVW